MTEVTEVNVSQRGTMAEGEGGGKGGKLKLIIIIVAVLILLAGGVVGAMVLLGGGEEGGAGAAATAARIAGAGESCPTDQLAYLALGEFVVNLADGRRYLKTSIDLMLCDESVQSVKEYISVRLSEVKDLVISELQTLSTEQLRDQRERELLRQRLLRRVESLLPNDDVDWDDPNPIKKVLITEFYLQ